MSYQSKLKSPATDELIRAMLSIRDEEVFYRFLEDLCTVKEIRAMAQRFEVAKLLLEKRTYNDIEEATGASTATISRINRTLQYGADGYKNVLDGTADTIQ